ncbi:MAG: PIN domain-containing protein [Bacteroidia bacterium]
MEIILDTNVINGDLLLKGLDLKKLCITARENDHTLYIPKVVLMEMEKHYDQALRESYKQTERGANIFEKLTESNVKRLVTIKELDSYASNYPKVLHKRMKELGIEILPIPRDNDATIINKAVHRKKPFKENGVGYPDALLWHTILQKAKKFSGDRTVSSPRIIFITDNHNDFCKSADCELHSDLIEDLEEDEINPVAIKIVKKIEEAFKMLYVKPDITLTKDIAKFLSSRNFNSTDFYKDIVDRVMKLLPYRAFESDEVGLPDSFESPTIDMFEEDFKFELQTIDVLDKEQVSIKWSMSVTCLLDIYIPKSDLGYFENNSPIVYNYDWNDHYVAAQQWKNIWFDVEAIADNRLQTVENLEIEINEDRNQPPERKSRRNDLD